MKQFDLLKGSNLRVKDYVLTNVQRRQLPSHLVLKNKLNILQFHIV